MLKRLKSTLLMSTLVCGYFLVSPIQAKTNNDDCLIDAIKSASVETTVGELRIQCASNSNEWRLHTRPTAAEQNVVHKRLTVEDDIAERAFAITAHQPNYLAFSTSRNPNQSPFIDIAKDPNPVDNNEMVFQVSVKAPIWRNVFGSNVDAYVGYTAKSWWQLFADDEFSAPFRETNYQPELFLRGKTDKSLLGVSFVGWDVGFNHESNGRSDPLSRSWNRIMGRAAIEVTDNLNIFARAWYRLPEDEQDDDNPQEY